MKLTRFLFRICRSSIESITMNLPNIVSIAISGATNSGKTTLTRKLRQHFPYITSFCQDDYFVEIGAEGLEKVEELDSYNWDVPSAVNTDQMVKDIKSWVASCPPTDKTVHLLLVEGFLLFHHSELAKMFDQKYFLKVSKDICVERRRKRSYDPPDCEGYFEKIVWPNYLKNLEYIADQKDIIYLESNDTNMEEMFETIKGNITSIMTEKQEGHHQHQHQHHHHHPHDHHKHHYHHPHHHHHHHHH
ncbi:nicotinamide riboside kinase 1-like [Argonauta hians]